MTEITNQDLIKDIKYAFYNPEFYYRFNRKTTTNIVLHFDYVNNFERLTRNELEMIDFNLWGIIEGIFRQ